jgi:polysaccharide chain length determinant protein (PEP-CTERM system associated)
MTLETTARASNDEPRPGAGLEQLQSVWTRRKWLAILVFALPLAAASGVILSLPNLYRSTATVVVDRQQVPESFVRPTVTSEIETRLQTISQEILSRSRLEALIDRFGLYSDLRQRESNEEVIDRMRRDIHLELQATESRGDRRTTVAFTLSYRGRDPQTVAVVTNTLASFYIEENLKVRERQASGTTEFLKAQISEAKKRLDDQEREVSQFKQRHLGELPQQMQSSLTTLEMLNAQLWLNSDNQARAVQRRGALASELSDAASFGQAPGTPGLPAPDSRAQHLSQLQQDLTAAQTRYTDAHPTVMRLKKEIAAVESELANAKRREPVEGTSAAKPERAPTPGPSSAYLRRLQEGLESADAEIKIMKAEEKRLRAAIAAYQTRVGNIPRLEQEFQDISRNYETTKEQHQSLVKRYEDAQLAESMEQRQKGEQFRIVDPAIPSKVTVAPNRIRLLTMALAVSLGLAAGVVVLAEMLDTSFHEADELHEFTGIPVLVRIAPIATRAAARQVRIRFRLATAAALVSLVLIGGSSYLIAHNNEQLVRLLDRN